MSMTEISVAQGRKDYEVEGQSASLSFLSVTALYSLTALILSSQDGICSLIVAERNRLVFFHHGGRTSACDPRVFFFSHDFLPSTHPSRDFFRILSLPHSAFSLLSYPRKLLLPSLSADEAALALRCS